MCILLQPGMVNLSFSPVSSASFPIRHSLWQGCSRISPVFAAAYAEAGQFDNAVAEQERAIEMLRTAGRDNEVADFQSRLELYRNRQPYRE